MPTDRFINERKGAWQRLEELLRLLDKMSLRRLHREEVREIGRIYRRTSSDLAIARAESRDPRLVNYLNSLVIRAHGRIYRTEAMEGGRRLRNFFLRDFPRTFRRTWKFTATAFAFCLVFGLVGFFCTWRDADFSELVGINYVMRDKISSGVHWWEQLNDANQIGGAAIMTNNIQVMFNAFAMGAMLGVGTLLVMAFNGLNIAYRAGFGNDLVTFMVGHGVIELSCIFIAGGAGLLVGAAILAPGDLSRFDALRLRGREAIHLIVGCIPLLVVAGTIEGFISPAPIAPVFKFATAAVTGVALYAYLLLGGRETERKS
jgi:uncharacterized membrane protein SpoIIM required for sporulation